MTVSVPALRIVPSGTKLCLLMLALMGCGAFIAIRPGLQSSSRTRKKLARHVGQQLRARYPDATLYVKADLCRDGRHSADVTLFMNRKLFEADLVVEEAKLCGWFDREHPDLFLKEFVLTVKDGSRPFTYSHE